MRGNNTTKLFVNQSALKIQGRGVLTTGVEIWGY